MLVKHVYNYNIQYDAHALNLPLNAQIYSIVQEICKPTYIYVIDKQHTHTLQTKQIANTTHYI